MRIESIKQASGLINDGLGEISMRQLNRIVILAGANGSGKTRMLGRVQVGGDPGNSNDFRIGFHFVGEMTAPVQFVSKELRVQDSATNSIQANIQSAGTECVNSFETTSF